MIQGLARSGRLLQKYKQGKPSIDKVINLLLKLLRLLKTWFVDLEQGKGLPSCYGNGNARGHTVSSFRGGSVYIPRKSFQLTLEMLREQLHRLDGVISQELIRQLSV
jgi:hypothetical protein